MDKHKDIIVPPHLQDYDNILKELFDLKEGLTFKEIHDKIMALLI